MKTKPEKLTREEREKVLLLARLCHEAALSISRGVREQNSCFLEVAKIKLDLVNEYLRQL